MQKFNDKLYNLERLHNLKIFNNSFEKMGKKFKQKKKDDLDISAI